MVEACGGVDAFEGDGDLELEDLFGQVGLALGEVLADADDGDEAVGEGGLELEVDGVSVSLKYWRRSEWPRRTWVTPMATSMVGEVSPV